MSSSLNSQLVIVITFEDRSDKDQTAQGVQSDLWATLSHVLLNIHTKRKLKKKKENEFHALFDVYINFILLECKGWGDNLSYLTWR